MSKRNDRSDKKLKMKDCQKKEETGGFCGSGSITVVVVVAVAGGGAEKGVGLAYILSVTTTQCKMWSTFLHYSTRIPVM